MSKHSRRLLIVTQKVDRNDSVLGFMHYWIQKMANNYANIIVICLYQGEYLLPQNVRVLSLGKEGGQSRFKYFWRLAKYLWQERKNYERVFIHMNIEYILLAGWWWRLTGQPIDLWYNHRFGNKLTTLAVALADRVFCTSRFSYVARFSKTKLVPAGIDTEMFERQPDVAKDLKMVLYVGRISPVKKLNKLIEAAGILYQWGVNFNLKIIGENAGDKVSFYLKALRQNSQQLAPGRVHFMGPVKYNDLPEIYNSALVLVNLTQSGSFDKVLLEAMACETLAATTNPDLTQILPPLLVFSSDEPIAIATQLEKILQLSSVQVQSHTDSLRSYVVDHHSLAKLIEVLATEKER